MKHMTRWLLLGWLGVALAQTPPPELHWDPGSKDCDASKQRTAAQAIDDVTIAIRQNPCIDFEAPIMYLLLGEERALLIDTGATDDPRLTGELTALVEKYLYQNGARLPLVVAHTHGHQDHRSGDAAFASLPDTTVVPVKGEDMRAFFQFQGWPGYSAEFDLGNRRVWVMATPGHHPDHVVFIDEHSNLAFTGDFYLPGRLIVDNLAEYHQSALGMGNVVAEYGPEYAMGAHVEVNSKNELYADGATYHPDERQVAIYLHSPDAMAYLRQDLEEFNGFYLKSGRKFYVIVNPVHNLVALIVGVIAVLALLTWGGLRLRQTLKARRAVAE